MTAAIQGAAQGQLGLCRPIISGNGGHLGMSVSSLYACAARTNDT